jgi:prolyl oligopeptidase
VADVVYPRAPRVDLVETLHGVHVADPFRTLENADDPRTATWVAEENALTRRMLDTPHRAQLVERLRVLHRYPRTSVPAVRGNRLFFLENDGTKNQAALCIADWGLRSADSNTASRVLVDPNGLDDAGTTAITAFEADDEGNRVAYALSRHGSDMQELRVHEVAAGADLGDCVRWVKFASIAWSRDGFFYTRFPEPGTVPPEHEQYFCQVWFHRLGDTQEQDRLIHARPDAPDVVFEVHATSDGAHLVITSHRGASDNAEVITVRLKPDTTYDGSGAYVVSAFRRTLAEGFSNAWQFIDGAGDLLYFRTDLDAPLGRIVAFNLGDAAPAPREVIPESADKLSMAAIGGGRFIVSYLERASDRLRIFELDGRRVEDLELPGIGTIVGIAARWHDGRSYVTFTSFTTPPRIFECDVAARRVTPIAAAAANASVDPPAFDPAQYVTEQVWYESKDGTPVSMFLVQRVGSARPAPVLLTGYGGFNISLTPSFDPSDFLWLDAGGIIAVANLRGGGEYGEAWHRAGMLDRKQNVFDDFIAAAEWLTAGGHAAPGAIAIEGGSNGGLLVGAVMTQRPDLFGAVVCRVPVADMLRYHLFTVGRFWIPEYGSADEPQQFEYLLRYSPLHNVSDGIYYPATLIMTADTDDRVAPGMAKKFAARLQEAVGAGGGPILLRVETRAGHGAGKPISKQVDEQADIHEFLFQYLTRTTANEQQRLR